MHVELQRRLDEAKARSDAELAEARRREAAASVKEAELLRKQRELEERVTSAGVDLEQQLAAQRAKVLEEADQAARARLAAQAVEAEQALTRLESELVTVRKRADAAAANEAELLRMRRELEAAAANAVLEREQTLAAERASVRAEAERVVEERMALRSAERLEEQRRESAARLGDVMQDLEEARKRVESAALKERELLRRERELTEARSTIDLETERRMVAERSKIHADAEAQAAARISLVQEQARLRDKEQEEKTAQLQRSVDALQQRLTQGPQQAQGEAQERVLKDILVEAFGEDGIEDVEKGVRGADLVHRVYSASGAECGTILWESKRTQGWSEGWLEKLRDDQRAIGAACAIIVTQALPPGVKSFAVVDGVWVCGWSYASALATALRMGMHDLHQARRTTEGRDTKMHLLYDYLIGHEFRNRITGVIESMVSLQEQLQHEQRAFTRIWKKRGTMLTRAITQIGSVHGDLEGIVGSELAELAPLALPSGTRALGAGEQDEPDDGDLLPKNPVLSAAASVA